MFGKYFTLSVLMLGAATLLSTESMAATCKCDCKDGDESVPITVSTQKSCTGPNCNTFCRNRSYKSGKKAEADDAGW